VVELIKDLVLNGGAVLGGGDVWERKRMAH
jgi:hypothetical protein